MRHQSWERAWDGINKKQVFRIKGCALEFMSSCVWWKCTDEALWETYKSSAFVCFRFESPLYAECDNFSHVKRSHRQRQSLTYDRILHPLFNPFKVFKWLLAKKWESSNWDNYQKIFASPSTPPALLSPVIIYGPAIQYVKNFQHLSLTLRIVHS